MIRISKIVFFSLLLTACGKTYIPKPYGYFRVEMPEQTYRRLDTLNLPFTFDVPAGVKITDRATKEDKYWIDLSYPYLNANIYCSYKPVKGNLMELLEDTRRIVYKHSIKADGIKEKVFENEVKEVHGILYDLKGNTASSLQFILTDSSTHFFRAALYFNNVPNKDSIAPMADYVRDDMIRLMESFEWKK